MIYSYKVVVIPGSQGHVKNYKPNDSELIPGNPRWYHLISFNGRSYIQIPKEVEIVEQDPEIDFKQETVTEELSKVLRQYANPVYYRDVYFDCLTLDSQKKFLCEELDAISAKFENNLNKDMYFTSALGFKVNGDRRTATNIAGLISIYDLPPNSGNPIDYRDYDNQTQSLNKEQLQQLYLEHLANGNALYSQKWEKEEAIKNAQSSDELMAVSLEFKMQDFSQVSLANVLQDNSKKRDEDHKTTLSSILKL